MAVDPGGNSYLTGARNYALLNNGTNASSDVFVTKLDATGQVVWTRTFGGSGGWVGTAIAVARTGEIYVAGTAGSADLLLSNALQASPTGAFILKLSADGNTVLYSTYFGGGTGSTTINAIATDASANLYLTGITSDRAFPVTAGMPGDPGIGPYQQDGFLTEISAAGDRIIYSGLIAGSKVPCPQSFCGIQTALSPGVAIAVNSKGEAYVAGNTNTTDLMTTAGVVGQAGIGAYVAKVNAGGAAFGFITYLGAGVEFSVRAAWPENVAHGMTLDSAGNVYVAGATSDPKFPATAGAYQTSYAGTSGTGGNLSNTNAFVAKLAADGSRIIWATYIGGTGPDSAQTVAVDGQGYVWISGTANSPQFPNTNGWSNGGEFLVEVSSTGAALDYAGRYPAQTVALSIGLDSSGMVHAAGPTGIVSGIMPGTAPVMRVFGVMNLAGGEITGSIATGEMVTIYGPHIGPSTAVSGSVSNGALPTTLGGVQVLFGSAAAPLLYVSDSEIQAMVPSGDVGDTIVIANGQNVSPAFPVGGAAAPQVFLSGAPAPCPRCAAGIYAAALNQDGTANSAANPAKVGSLVSIWVNGAGSVQIPVGQIVTKASNVCMNGGPVQLPCTAVQVNLYGGVVPGPIAGQAAIQYAGPAPGVMQINFIVPPQMGAGLCLFNVTANGVASHPVAVFTTQ